MPAAPLTRTRYRIAALTAIVAVSFVAVRSETAQPITPFDIVLAGGRVMDPATGLDAIRHVGIRNGEIAAVSPTPLTGKQTIDVTGLVVAPGFIDPHAHAQTLEGNRFQARDGVTTALELESGAMPIGDWYQSRNGQRAPQLRRDHRPHLFAHRRDAREEHVGGDQPNAAGSTPIRVPSGPIERRARPRSTR